MVLLTGVDFCNNYLLSGAIDKRRVAYVDYPDASNV